MLICRPFFPTLILHWHAAGLAAWLETTASPLVRAVTRRLLHQPSLSIVMSQLNQADGEWFQSRQIAVARLGIADPCPNYESEILPRREARVAARNLSQVSAGQTATSPTTIHVLYLAHCMREKGFFDTIDGVVLANEQMRAEGLRQRFYLTLAGSFHAEAERVEFNQRMEHSALSEDVRWLGFVSGEQKRQCLEEADLLCFPTYYRAENQPVTLIEAMAFGLPIVTTNWRAIPDMLPGGYAGLIVPKSPAEVARALRTVVAEDPGLLLRQHFLRHFTLQQHIQDMAAAFHLVEK
jgi:glycosyltransferase involved in cell wall biosynthesis